jgi:hypothetical protein
LLLLGSAGSLERMHLGLYLVEWVNERANVPFAQILTAARFPTPPA